MALYLGEAKIAQLVKAEAAKISRAELSNLFRQMKREHKQKDADRQKTLEHESKVRQAEDQRNKARIFNQIKQELYNESARVQDEAKKIAK